MKHMVVIPNGCDDVQPGLSLILPSVTQRPVPSTARFHFPSREGGNSRQTARFPHRFQSGRQVPTNGKFQRRFQRGRQVPTNGKVPTLLPEREASPDKRKGSNVASREGGKSRQTVRFPFRFQRGREALDKRQGSNVVSREGGRFRQTANFPFHY